MYSKLFVVLMGMGTVFVGLICIIVLCMLMGKILVASEKKEAKGPAAPAQKAPAPAAAAPAPAPVVNGMDPKKVTAIITAVLAQEIGVSSSKLNVTNIKKI